MSTFILSHSGSPSPRAFLQSLQLVCRWKPASISGLQCRPTPVGLGMVTPYTVWLRCPGHPKH